MTDEPEVPMSDQPDPASEPTQPSAVAPPSPEPLPEPQWWQSAQTPPTPPPPPVPASAWSAPPAWGSAPQGWPPPPPVTPPAPEDVTAVQPPGSVPPPVGPPTGPGTWGYGYGPPTWGAPPPANKPSKVARAVLIGVAVVALALASGGVGAAISSAVHSNSNNTSSALVPSNGLGNGSNNNGLGNGNGFPFDFGNGNGNGSSSSGNGTAPSAITSKVNPSIVDIFTTIDTGTSTGEAAGTGMVISSDGEVLTNNHVIDGATKVRIEVIGTGETHTAKVLGYDVVDDVALLKIDDVSGLTPIDTADASSVQIGDAVVALGNAGGRGGTPVATTGSVTALDQKVTAGDSGTGDSETLHGMIQISAPIEPGDSGGPLVDADGRVVGMNTAAAQNDGFVGGSGSTTAFAIPIDKAMQVVSQIRDGHDSNTVHVGDRAILGVQVRNVPQSGDTTPSTAGAAVVGVKSGTPADSAGIGENDVITAVNGSTVRSASDLTSMMFSYHPGDSVKITWVGQNGDSHSASMTLIAGPPN